MNCKICGKPLSKGSSVCKYCGADNSTGKGKRRRSKKARRRQRIVTIIMLILVLILLAAVIFGIVKMVQKLRSEESHSISQSDSSGKAPDKDSGKDSDKDSNKDNEPDDTDIDKQPEEDSSEDPKAPDNNETPVKPEQPEENVNPENGTGTGETVEVKEPEDMMPTSGTDSVTGTASDPLDTDGGRVEEAQGGYEYVVSTKTYTVSLNKTETTATLNHYREIRYSFDQTLEPGVKVVAESWKSSDESIVHIEMDGDTCRAWGKKVGDATVTLTIELNNGQTIIRNVEVHVSETKSSNTGSGNGSSGSLGDGDYILKNSATHLYTEAELSVLSARELMLARNEIYARHGYIFNSSDIQSYFESKSWYHGTDTVDTFDFTQLNSTERANVSTIKKVEKNR